MTVARFLVPSEVLKGTQAVLTGAELHHLRVRRLRVGNEVVLSDALGRQRRGIVLSVQHREAVIQLTDDAVSQRESPLRLTLAQAALRSSKLDVIIEKATELGVAEVIVFTSDRSIRQVSTDRIGRLNRIARSATKQCQRSKAPVVSGPLRFTDLFCTPPATISLLFWEERAAAEPTLSSAALHGTRSALAVVGPEGGFSPAEAAQATTAGFLSVSLGPRILRAETAAIAAVTICQFLWGDVGQHTGPLP